MNRRSFRVVIAAALAIDLMATNLGSVSVAARPGPQAKVVAATTSPITTVPGAQAALQKLSIIESQQLTMPKFATRAPHAAGGRVAGPAMLKRPVHPKLAQPDPLAMSASFRQLHGIPAPQNVATAAPIARIPQALVATAAPIRPQSARAPTTVRRLASVSLTTPSYTGINHYWTYEEDAIPGVGKRMANIGTGNVLVQADDMAIAHKGIGLAFRRTYNSLSQHDYVGTDGSQISNYGAGWTNTFDAHIALNSGNQYGQGISVYDIDGARYDYLSDGQGHWLPPAGQYATLTYDGGNGYFWTKKTGTAYYFWYPFGASLAGLSGRLSAIYGRNNNASLSFSYSFDNFDDTCSCHLSVVNVSEEDGRLAQLLFSDFTVNGQPQRLLSSLIWPNGTTVTYSYDTNGNLTDVDEPPNNTYSTQCQGGLTQCLPQVYGYVSGSLISFIAGPRYVMGSLQGISDWTGTTQYGGWVAFSFDTNNALAAWGRVAFMNPTPNDPTNTPIQQGLPNWTHYRRDVFGSRTSTSLNWSDTDGHQTIYTFDASGRVTQRQDWNGSVYLTTTQTWDAQNSLISSTDARGLLYETDYAYDTNGNAIAVAPPAVSNSDGTYRPTSFYSYDQNNNITSSCDAEFVHNSLHADWVTRPTAIDTLCPQQSGATRMTWTGTAAEPFGELSSVVKPLGQTISYTYDPGHQGGTDYGQPTYISGATVPATQTLTYDGPGNVTTYDKGTGGAWQLTYDSIGRLLTAADPDNVASYTTYLTDGAVSKTETAFQHANGMGVIFSYDADGNVVSETHHHGCAPGAACTAGVTLKWYDGADRLVEVSQPGTWLTRYIYDLTIGGTVSLASGAPFSAHGNLYATRENYGFTWTDMRGNAYDSMDRVTAKFTYQPCVAVCTEAPVATTYAFDSSAATLGLLTSSTDALSETSTYAYDADGRKTAVAFSGDGGVTPGRTYTFDGDGRVVTTASSVGTQSYSYDANGRRLTSVQPLGNGTSATMTYGYYDNGLKQSVSVNSPNANYTNLISWGYRTDGLMNLETAMGGSFTRTYTPAGRETAFQDPYFTANRTYDSSTGLLTSHDIAAGTYSSITHDFEGSVVGYTAYAGQAVTSTLTQLGELTAQTFNPGGLDPLSGADTWPTLAQSFTNGHATSGSGSSDFRNAVTTMTEADGSGGCSTDMPSLCTWQLGKNFSFDTAGRESSGAMTWNETYSCGGSLGNGGSNPGSGYNSICSHNHSGSFTAQYDAENHLLGKTYQTWIYSDSQPSVIWPASPGASYTTGYTYGPTGHPIKMAGDTVIWDDDAILLTLNAAGQVDDIRVGLDADYNAAGTAVSVWDRDLGDAITSSHNSTGHDAWIPAHPYRKVLPQAPVNAPTASPGFSGGQTAPITSPGSDGYFDGDSVIQGVRAYDPQLGAWTAPDAYAGDVHDPMSQKPYMWNRNNSYDYGDPTGYDTVYMYSRPIDLHGIRTPFSHTFIEVSHREKDGSVTITRFSFGPTDESVGQNLDGSDITASKLHSQGQDFDAQWSGGTNGAHGAKLASCNGTCSRANGGFDEASLDKNKKAIDEKGLGYEAPHNSNGATSTLCSHGGGGDKCSQAPGGANAPDFGNDLLPQNSGGGGTH
jgi:YD repeat-containing protein